ncbi:phage tail assembly chaperone [Bacillus massiliigorillae]|uniref:phage tail assembly chaperone n=1 Tax=Bacillus massiliigorillae TaxID=1243664 RepID=UPI0003AAA223|nr:hypothetical protein [Bacillus massiliigorillae]
MNTIDLLMSMDKGTFKPHTKQIKISRLSTEENPFVLDVSGLSQPEVEEITDQILKTDANGKPFYDNAERIYLMLIKGIKNIDLKSTKLMEYFGVKTPYDLIKKLFLPGEIDKIDSAINELSGYKGDAITEVKN